MPWDMRTERLVFILIIGGAIGGGIALALVSQSLFPEPIKPLEFERTGSVCGESGVARANISSGPVADGYQRATVTGVMVAPRPCTRINASLVEPQNNTYRIDLQLLPNTTSCRQCVGNLRYRATLNLPPAVESVAVTHNGQVMAEHRFKTVEQETRQLPDSAP